MLRNLQEQILQESCEEDTSIVQLFRMLQLTVIMKLTSDTGITALCQISYVLSKYQHPNFDHPNQLLGSSPSSFNSTFH